MLISGQKLKDASEEQQFNRNIEDVEVWMAEIEGQLMSEDFGKVRIYVNFSVNIVDDLKNENELYLLRFLSI